MQGWEVNFPQLGLRFECSSQWWLIGEEVGKDKRLLLEWCKEIVVGEVFSMLEKGGWDERTNLPFSMYII